MTSTLRSSLRAATASLLLATVLLGLAPAGASGTTSTTATPSTTATTATTATTPTTPTTSTSTTSPPDTVSTASSTSAPEPVGLGPATGDPAETSPSPPPDTGTVTSAMAPPTGGIAASAGLATGKNLDGRLEVFAVDLQGGLIHAWQLTPNGVWSAWQWMGVFVQGRPTLAPAPDGRMEIFAIEPAGGIIHAWQLTPNGAWSAWHWMGEFAAEAPSVGSAPDGRLELFASDRAGGLIHAWQLTPNGVWSGWAHMNATGRGAPTVTRQANGRLIVITVERSGSMDAAVQVEPNGVFGPWEWTGTMAEAPPAVGLSKDGRLELFAKDLDGGLIHRWQIGTEGSWSDWHWMGISTLEAPAVATAPDLRLELFARDLNGGVVHAWQVTPNGIWSAWTWMGVFAQGPRFGRSDVRTVELELGTAARPLHTTVYHPALGGAGAPAAFLPGPFPLLVFAHGFAVSAATYASLLTDLASRGYVVAAPDFSRSSTYYPGPRQSDTVAQAADVARVIDRLSGAAQVDPSHIGVLGHSDGGITAAGIGFNAAARDARVKAVAVLTGAATDFAGDWFPMAGAPAALFVHGSADGVNAYSRSASMFARAQSPKYLLRIEGGTHLAPFTQPPIEPLVVAVIADFFDLRLAGRPNAEARLAGDGREAGLTLVTG